MRDALTQVGGEEVGVETDNIDWVCVERGRVGREVWREVWRERKHGREVGRGREGG